MAESFLREDAAEEYRDYAFLYQLTHITSDRSALTHDDRVDAVAHFQRAMMMDVDQAAKAMPDEEMQQEIEDFIEGFNQPTSPPTAACGLIDSGSLRVIPARVVRG